METPSRHSYDLDGTLRVFPVASPIKGDNYCRLEVDGVIINDRTQYDIVNNSIVFKDTSLLPSGSQLDILVVQSEEAIGQLAITTSIDTVAANIADVNAVANDLTNVDIVATNITDVNSVADNMAEVLLADTNAATATAQATIATTQAGVATTKASEASASAAAALVSETNAAASEATSSSNAAATAADRVQTGLDASATAADVLLTAADRVQTGLDASATAADVIVTNADALATAADVVTTNADAATATTKASEASASEAAAAISETNAAGSAAEAAGYASVLGYNFEPTVKPTLSLDFANNEHSFYDGIENSFTQAPLDDLVTVSNGSANAYDARGRLSPVSANKARLTFNPETGESEGLLVEEARTNFALYSEDLTQSVWGKNSTSVTFHGTVTPSGSTNGNKLTKTATAFASMTQAFTATVGESYSFSVFVKAGTNDTATILLTGDNGATLSARLVFNIASGVVTDYGSTDLIGYNVREVGGGWYRFQCSATLTTNSNPKVYIYPDFYNQANAGDIYIWGAQLEQGSFPTSPIQESATFNSRASTATYYDSTGTLQTAAIDEARYTYNPADLTAPPVLMDEVERTNLALYSEDLTGVFWLTAGVTKTADSLITTVGSQVVLTSGNVSSISGAPYTGTWEFSKSSYTLGDGVFFSIDDTTSTNRGIATFNVSDMSLINISNQGTFSNTYANIIDLGDTFKIVLTTTVVGTSIRMRMFNVTANTLSGSTVCPRRQLEQGSYPTSYIPTTTAAVTRSADNVTYSQSTRVADSVYRDLSGYEFGDEFSVYVEFSTEYNVVPYFRGIIALAEGSDYISIMNPGTTTNVELRSTFNTNPYRLILGSLGEDLKIVFSAKGTTITAYANGVMKGTAEIDTVDFSLLSSVLFGKFNKASTSFNGNEFKDFKIYPKALSESECIALTGGA